MKKNQLLLNILKYTVFVTISLSLLLFWKGAFILQGGIGIEGNLLLLPVKLLPLFLYSTFAFWLTLKMFDQKDRIPQKRNVSFAVGTFALVLSLAFQLSLSKRVAPFVFKNEMFSHLRPVKVSNEFKNRMILSSVEYIRLMPLGFIGDSTSYILNVAAESFFVFTLKKLIDNENIKKTCREYIKFHGDHNDCIIDFQKNIHSHYQFSSTGNILVVAVGALGTFKIKKLMAKQYGKKDLYVLVKSINDIIETSMLSAEKSKYIVLNKDRPVVFTMGHELQPSSLLGTIEREINYKFLFTTIGKVGDLISKVEKKISSIKRKDQKRKISSLTKPKLEREKLRFNHLKSQFLAFQEGGFKIDDLKLKHKEMEKEMEIKLNQLKDESFMFKIAAFFDNSLYQLTVDDLLKDISPKNKNAENKSN